MTPAVDELPEDGDELGDELPRMSLLEHLDELRRRILNSVVTLLIAFLVCWYFSPQIFSWLERPIRDVLPPGDKLAFTDLAGPFMLYVKVALLAARCRC